MCVKPLSEAFEVFNKRVIFSSTISAGKVRAVGKASVASKTETTNYYNKLSQPPQPCS